MGGDRAETDKKTLFVRNLPWSASEDEILGLECFQKAVNCRIAHDRETGRPRGFAHIEFEDEAGAEEGFKIAEANTPELQGRDLMVDFTGSKSTSWPRRTWWWSWSRRLRRWSWWLWWWPRRRWIWRS